MTLVALICVAPVVVEGTTAVPIGMPPVPGTDLFPVGCEIAAWRMLPGVGVDTSVSASVGATIVRVILVKVAINPA